ncbi:MAG: DivIVA domain-containing protein [Microbacteriaceae bacterium]
MALSPDDVVNKRFQTTKFRDGYDQDQVDDFLDEVVVELRRLNKENEDLRAQMGSETPIAAPVAAAVIDEVVDVIQTPSVLDTGVINTLEAEEEGSTGLLVLARRLHEEHVREGIEKRDALIAEGQAAAAKLVADAQVKQQEVLSALEGDRAVLQRKVDELRSFEGEYRRKIKTHLEELIGELNTTGAGD